MKITELNYKNRIRYTDSNNIEWLVTHGELIDNQYHNIHYTYTIEEMSKLNFVLSKED